MSSGFRRKRMLIAMSALVPILAVLWGSDRLGPAIFERPRDDVERDFVFGVEPSNVAFLRTDSELLVGVLLYVFNATIEGRIPLLTINPEEAWHCAAHNSSLCRRLLRDEIV